MYINPRTFRDDADWVVVDLEKRWHELISSDIVQWITNNVDYDVLWTILSPKKVAFNCPGAAIAFKMNFGFSN